MHDHSDTMAHTVAWLVCPAYGFNGLQWVGKTCLS